MKSEIEQYVDHARLPSVVHQVHEALYVSKSNEHLIYEGNNLLWGIKNSANQVTWKPWKVFLY